MEAARPPPPNAGDDGNSRGGVAFDARGHSRGDSGMGMGDRIAAFAQYQAIEGMGGLTMAQIGVDSSIAFNALEGRHSNANGYLMYRYLLVQLNFQPLCDNSQLQIHTG